MWTVHAIEEIKLRFQISQGGSSDSCTLFGAKLFYRARSLVEIAVNG